MARQNINVGAAPNDGTGDPLRNAMIKANANFVELYAGKDAVTVANFAALPAPATTTGERWWVLNSTGVWLMPGRRNKGAYYSDGVDWIYLGDFPQAAAEVTLTPVGIVTATDVQAGVAQLEAAIAAIGPSTALAGEAIITAANGFEVNQTVAAVGMTATKKVIISSAGYLDSDENDAEMLDIADVSAFPGTDTLTFVASFSTLTNGPLKFNWSAF